MSHKNVTTSNIMQKYYQIRLSMKNQTSCKNITTSNEIRLIDNTKTLSNKIEHVKLNIIENNKIEHVLS